MNPLLFTLGIVAGPFHTNVPAPLPPVRVELLRFCPYVMFAAFGNDGNISAVGVALVIVKFPSEIPVAAEKFDPAATSMVIGYVPAKVGAVVEPLYNTIIAPIPLTFGVTVTD